MSSITLSAQIDINGVTGWGMYPIILPKFHPIKPPTRHVLLRVGESHGGTQECTVVVVQVTGQHRRKGYDGAQG